MDSFIFARVGKPAFMFLVTFLAILLSTHNTVAALIIAIIPAVLGLSNTSAVFGYQVTVSALLFSVMFGLTPDYIKHPVLTMLSDVSHSIATSVQQAHPETASAPAGNRPLTTR